LGAAPMMPPTLTLAERLGEALITGDSRLYNAVHPVLGWVLDWGLFREHGLIGARCPIPRHWEGRGGLILARHVIPGAAAGSEFPDPRHKVQTG
jgi:hypothetical protein